MLGSLRKARPDPGPRRRLEAALHEALALGSRDVVRISEVSCGAYGCNDVVIAVLVMREARKAEIYRVERNLGTVTLVDLLDAIDPPPADPRAMSVADALARLSR